MVPERTKTEAMEQLQRARVPGGAVFDTGELSEDPYLRRRGMFATIDHPTRGRIVIPGFPVKLSESAVAVMTSPLLGEHTEEVLSEWLGMTSGQVDEYKKSIVSAPPEVALR